jgi:hypothetical protein
MSPSDHNRLYAGSIQIQPDEGGSLVTGTLELRGRLSDQGGLTSEQVQDGIGKGHKSIKNHVEGRGGKEEPAAG